MPTTKRAPLPYGLTLIPPLILALSFPGIFFNALEFAGVFGVLILFGILPPAMTWESRYSATRSEVPSLVSPILPGGRITLILLMGAAGSVIGSDIVGRITGALGT